MGRLARKRKKNLSEDRKPSTSLVIREMQIKTIIRYHLTPVRMALIKSLQTVNAGEGVEKRERFCTVGGNVS